MSKNDLVIRRLHERYAELLKPVPDGHYQCANCFGVFAKGRSDEQAEAERLEKFPDLPKSETVVVCDVCFNQMEAYFTAHPEALE